MVSTRKSVYLPDRLLPVLDLREDTGDSLSGRLAAIVDRYGVIVASATPPMTRAEWCMVLDACNGWASWAEAGETLMGGIAANVADHIRLNGAGEKWGLNPDQCAALVARLNALSPVQSVAVIERIERFWRRAPLPTPEAMRQAGIEPTDGVE